MHTFSRTRGLVVLVALTAMLIAAFAAVPQADAATIYTCVKKKSGTLRLVSKSTKCKKGESKLSWNTTGPAGKNGLNGLTGLNGANGAAGATGLTGPNGPMGKPIAEANSEGRAECTLGGENYCYPELAPVTPSSNAQCLVTVVGQITDPRRPAALLHTGVNCRGTGRLGRGEGTKQQRPRHCEHGRSAHRH
jgi:hypothetical protein